LPRAQGCRFDRRRRGLPAGRDRFDAAFQLGTLGIIDRQESHADRILADGRQFEVDDGAEEQIGDLRDDSCPIARAGIRPDCATVFEVSKSFKGKLDDVVAGRSTQRRDHRKTAGILLARRVVQPGGSGNRAEARPRRLPDRRWRS
jgi:hypothetical protein